MVRRGGGREKGKGKTRREEEMRRKGGSIG